MMVLMETSHGYKIVLADANYPAKSSGNLTVKDDGHGIL